MAVLFVLYLLFPMQFARIRFFPILLVLACPLSMIFAMKAMGMGHQDNEGHEKCSPSESQNKNFYEKK